MKGHLFIRIFNRHTLVCYLSTITLIFFLAGGQRSPCSFFLGFSALDSAGGLNLLKIMEWNLCVLAPVSASLLFLMPEMGPLSTYTILRTKTIRHWWIMRLAAVVAINYVFSLIGLFILPGRDMQMAEWLLAMVLFPLHTTLLSTFCAGGMLLLSSRAAVIFYLLVEGGLLVIGMAYPPVSLFLLPYWGMAQAIGAHWGAVVAVSLLLFAVLNLCILYWLDRHNPAANPQYK